MTVPYEEDPIYPDKHEYNIAPGSGGGTPEPDPKLPDPIHKTGNLDYGGDVWVKIMIWIIGSALIVIVLMLVLALIVYLADKLF